MGYDTLSSFRTKIGTALHGRVATGKGGLERIVGRIRHGGGDPGLARVVLEVPIEDAKPMETKR